jgi:hypothetical protein
MHPELEAIFKSIEKISFNMDNKYKETNKIILKELDKSKSILEETFTDAFDIRK